MSSTRNFVYSDSESSTEEEEVVRNVRANAKGKRDETSSDSSSESESSSSDEEPVRNSRGKRAARTRETSSNESSTDDEEGHEDDEIKEHVQNMLTSLKNHYDQMVKNKLQDIETKKNVELEGFRRQEQAFKNEIEALKAERGSNVEVIEELRRELEEQRLSFEQTLRNILENN